MRIGLGWNLIYFFSDFAARSSIERKEKLSTVVLLNRALRLFYMGRVVSLVLGVLLGFLAKLSSPAMLYTVGDNLGWNLNINYTQWAAKYSFALGDSIVFAFSGSHSVLVVSEVDYVLCNIHNPIQSLQSGRAITLVSRKNFFICGIPGHCITGMKVAIYASLGSATASSAFSSTSSSSSSPSRPGLLAGLVALPKTLGILILLLVI